MNDVFTWPVGRAAHSKSPAPATPIVSYAIGTTLGGCALGVTLATFGLLLESLPLEAKQIVLIPLLLLLMVSIGLQAVSRVSPLPERRRQVPRDWLRWASRTRTAFCFGLVIGYGALTRLHAAIWYVMAIAIILSPSLWVGVLIGATYGMARGACLLLTWIVDVIVGLRIDWQRIDGSALIVRAVLCAVAAVLSAVILISWAA